MFFKHIVFALTVLVFSGIYVPQTQAQPRTVNFQIFYDELSPYGSWIESPDYGYVWLPNVDAGFKPYSSNGYWILTDVGWAWVSDYSWGWAPFHYGRWYSDAIYGFMWIPDNEWGPAWVNWRSSPDYYGWTPMGPTFGAGYHEHGDRWTFVRGQRLGDRNIHRYYMNNANNTTIYNNTTVINNYADGNNRKNYHPGPDRKDVEKRQGRAIVPMQIKENDQPGQRVTNRQLEIYRPKVEKTAGIAPTKVGKLQDAKTRDQRLNERKTNPAAVQPKRPAKTNQAPANQPIQRKVPTNKPMKGSRQKQTDIPNQTQRAEEPQADQPKSRAYKPIQPRQPQQAPPSKPDRTNKTHPAPSQQQPARPSKERMNNPAPGQQQPARPSKDRMNNPAPRQ